MCNSGCMVNAAYVKKVAGNDIYVGDDILQLSRGRKKEFMERYIDYLSRGCC